MNTCAHCGGNHQRSSHRDCVPGPPRDNSWGVFRTGRGFALLWWLIQNIKALRISQVVAILPTDRLEDRYEEKGGLVCRHRRAISSNILFQALVHAIGHPTQRLRHSQYFTAKFVLGRQADMRESKTTKLRPALPPEIVALVLPYVWGPNPLFQATPNNIFAPWFRPLAPPNNGRPGRRRLDGRRSRPLQCVLPSALCRVMKTSAEYESPREGLMRRIARFEHYGPAFFSGTIDPIRPTSTMKRQLAPVYPPVSPKRACVRPRLMAVIKQQGFWYHNYAARTILGLPCSEENTGSLKVRVFDRVHSGVPQEVRVSLDNAGTVADLFQFLSDENVHYRHAALLTSFDNYMSIAPSRLLSDVLPRPREWGDPASFPASPFSTMHDFPILRIYNADGSAALSLQCVGVDFKPQREKIKGIQILTIDWQHRLV